MTGLEFTQEDVKQYKLLDSYISKLASWSGTTSDIIQLHRSLVWFAKLGAKIEANQFEVSKVTQVTKPEGE